MILGLSLIILSCAKPIVFSGGDLPPERRALLGASAGIEFHQIDDFDVEGKLIILAPGSYAIAFSSTRDRKQNKVFFDRVVDIVDCTADITLAAGEELTLSSRLMVRSRSSRSIDHEIHFTSSLDDDSFEQPSITCDRTVDYDRVN